jgi:hypothetical protein
VLIGERLVRRRKPPLRRRQIPSAEVIEAGLGIPFFAGEHGCHFGSDDPCEPFKGTGPGDFGYGQTIGAITSTKSMATEKIPKPETVCLRFPITKNKLADTNTPTTETAKAKSTNGPDSNPFPLWANALVAKPTSSPKSPAKMVTFVIARLI